AAFHLHTMRPLARFYSKWALTQLSEDLEPEYQSSEEDVEVSQVEDEVQVRNTHVVAHDLDLALSKSEEIRIFRAFYRYQTFHHLFGFTKGRRDATLGHHEVNELFCGQFEPWENEALSCVDAFVREQYDDAVANLRSQRDLDSPRFWQLASNENIPKPEGTFDFINRYNDTDLLEGIVSHGLRLLVQLLEAREKRDTSTYCLVIGRYITYREDRSATLQDALSIHAQQVRRVVSHGGTSDAELNPRDAAQNTRQVIQFIGDAAPPDKTQPPFSWVLLWEGVYSNMYGEFVPSSLQRWGWVMWDQHRWDGISQSELFQEQWDPDRNKKIQVDLARTLGELALWQ
ncbi:hypothetical protein QBC35DRAFT_384059, partial [Podospora australis]